MTFFIITTGAGHTRRLIEADDVEGARNKFVFMLRYSDVPAYQRDFTLHDNEIAVHEATDIEIAEFKRSRRKVGADQLAFDAPGMERIEKQKKSTTDSGLS